MTEVVAPRAGEELISNNLVAVMGRMIWMMRMRIRMRRIKNSLMAVVGRRMR